MLRLCLTNAMGLPGVHIRVLQRHRTSALQGTDSHLTLESKPCKLETQGSWWDSSENQRASGCPSWGQSPSPSWGKRRPVSSSQTIEHRRQFPLPSSSRPTPAVQWLGWCPPVLPTCIGKAVYFNQSTNSNANLFWKHPHKQDQK